MLGNDYVTAIVRQYTICLSNNTFVHREDLGLDNARENVSHGGCSDAVTNNIYNPRRVVY
jgi:hypothetical protein